MCRKYWPQLLLIGLHVTKVAQGDAAAAMVAVSFNKKLRQVRPGGTRMNRSLKLSMLVALALGSSQLLAVDFGQVQVKSALGQPLLAEIPLHPTSPAELKSLTVKLASSEQFARAGIVGGRTSIPLHFSVANTAGNHPVIRITSSVPVDDPYLDLLIEVNGKAGPSVREYAILLDPPGMHAAAMAAATPAPAPVAPSQSRPAMAAAPTPQPAVAAPAPAPAPAPSGVNDGRYGPVQSGQTLTGIARNLAPAGVDVQQMLLALKQANPDAFYRDNINALKSGAVLRVPTPSEAQTMTLAAAMAEVRRQNSDWRAGTPGKPAVVADAATRASASSSPGTTPSSHGDRLALVPAKAGGDTGGNAGQGAESSAKLRDELLRTKESLASLQQQGSDLKTRLKDLSDINSKNEHLLSLKDSQIAELQAKLAAARKATGAPAPEARQRPPAWRRRRHRLRQPRPRRQLSPGPDPTPARARLPSAQPGPRRHRPSRRAVPWPQAARLRARPAARRQLLRRPRRWHPPRPRSRPRSHQQASPCRRRCR